MKHVILASQSKTRQHIIQTLNLPLRIHPADINEQELDTPTDPALRAQAIAKAKGEYIAKKFPNDIVIAADTYSVVSTTILEKPKSKHEATEMIQLLSGKQFESHTGFFYSDPENSILESTVITTKIWFRHIDEKEIKTYVSKFPVLEWSAAYSCAHTYILTFLQKIQGSVTGFTHGLPMEKVIPLLQQSGFLIQAQ